MNYTPMIEQYLEVKSIYPEDIVFFRLGDFYEMFFQDAERASALLDIVLTARDGGAEDRIPMCGIPYHSATNYINRLVQQGLRVVICEQVEAPDPKKPLVRREVVRVVTPGVTWDDNALDAERNNYLAAIYVAADFPPEADGTEAEESVAVGLAILDITTRECKLTEWKSYRPEQLLDELLKLYPAECLCSSAELLAFLREKFRYQAIALKKVDAAASGAEELISALKPLLTEDGLDAWVEGRNFNGLRALQMLTDYLAETKNLPEHKLNPRPFHAQAYLKIDQYTRRNLELVANLRDGKKEGSLLGILDHCRTPMGKRKIRQMILEPGYNMQLIERRLDAVGEFRDNIILQDGMSALLKGLHDLERLAGKITGRVILPREVIALKTSLVSLQALADFKSQVKSDLLVRLAGTDICAELCALIGATLNDEDFGAEGNLFRPGVDAELDEYRRITREGSRDLLALEQEERVRTGIKSLKIGYNKVFGYYLEISKSNMQLAPADYIRKQTLANCERYISTGLKTYEEKILTARERLLSLEQSLYGEFIESLGAHVDALLALAADVADLDVLHNLGRLAYRYNYIRPRIKNGRTLHIAGGRHPVVEQVLDKARFIPNDLQLSAQQNFAVITGPNMGGKSTFMRQAAIIILMVQIGSFVPAEQAEIGLVDQLFTRVGASDDLIAGQSTFMMEMLELAHILHHATERSFIILDEIGRGTSTSDGLCIAGAACDYIQEHIGALTLFATHYHELTELPDQVPGVFNLSVSVLEVEGQVTFLKKVIAGKADKSYGIHVAALAGMPAELIRNAEAQLRERFSPPAAEVVPRQGELFAALEDPAAAALKAELENLDVDRLSPREALLFLYKWKEKMTL
jgi:DNA mismatch repair protein MutS